MHNKEYREQENNSKASIHTAGVDGHPARGRRDLFRMLLSLLLIHILVVFAAPGIAGFQFSNLEEDQLIGGNSYVKTHALMSRCSGRFIRMSFSKKVDAMATDHDLLAQIQFQSVPGKEGSIRLWGNVTKKYLCFSRRGRPLLRYNGKSNRCRFNEIPYHGYFKYKSVVKDWYLGFNKHGRRLNGYSKRRRRRQRCYLFTKLSKRPTGWPYEQVHGPFIGLDPSQIKAMGKLGKR